MTLPFERLLIDRTLADRYRVEAVEGRGGMSVVFRAEDLRLGRRVALKVVVLPASGEEEERLRERFRREAASAASIPRHANVVQVYDYGTDPELALDFIVMELLHGEDLRQRLARGGPPPREEALRILLDAARGVAAGHRAGLVHRDVKPGNIFLVGESRLESVRVLDFGIAKPLAVEGVDTETLTVDGQLPHSPAYASPEQMDPAAEATPASDVYQLGLVAFETLTGTRPYTPAERERIRAGTSLPVPQTGLWAAVPPQIRAVVEAALSHEPSRRPRDAAAFAEALARAAEAARSGEDAPIAVAPPFPDRPVRSARIPPRVMAGAGALLGLLLAICTTSDGASPPPAVPADGVAGGLDATFLRLQGSVLGPAGGEAGEPRAVSAANATDQEVIRAAVHDLNRAWVDGDISRHVAHYASRVDYFNSRRLPRSGVRRDRTRELRRYAAMRRIDVGDIEIARLDEDRMRAVVRKAWDFRGEDRTRVGRGVVEYVFKRDEDGRWYVVSEQVLSQSEIRTPTGGG